MIEITMWKETREERKGGKPVTAAAAAASNGATGTAVAGKLEADARRLDAVMPSWWEPFTIVKVRMPFPEK